MKTDQELKHEVIDRIQECKFIAHSKGIKDMLPITVHFDLDTSSAGKATTYYNPITKIVSKQELRFNSYFLRKFPDHFIKQTVPHELAHLIVDRYFGLHIGHGSEWKFVMINYFDLLPDVYHMYGSTKYKLDEVYSCLCLRCNHVNMVSEAVAKRVQVNGMFGERCKNCKIKFSVDQTFSLTID